jgi:hypothetical protein
MGGRHEQFINAPFGRFKIMQTPENPMTSISDRLKFAGSMLLVALGVALAYTVLHEGGHALAGLTFGGRIGEIDLNFFNLGAHVNIDGNFTRQQQAVINIGGVCLPLLVWLVLVLSLSKKGNYLVHWTNFIATAGTLCSLLAWVVIPIFYLKNNAPAGDDVTRFLANSGLPPLAVSFAALALFTAGWFLYLRLNMGSLPILSGFSTWAGTPAPLWRLGIAGTVVVAALIGAWTLVTSTPGDGLLALPNGYRLAATLDLSTRNVQAETIARFELPKAGDAGILLRVSGIDTKFIDVTLVPSAGPALQLMHGEDFSSTASDSQYQYRLPAGEYGIVLTCRNSSGILKVYFRLP